QAGRARRGDVMRAPDRSPRPRPERGAGVADPGVAPGLAPRCRGFPHLLRHHLAGLCLPGTRRHPGAGPMTTLLLLPALALAPASNPPALFDRSAWFLLPAFAAGVFMVLAMIECFAAFQNLRPRLGRGIWVWAGYFDVQWTGMAYGMRPGFLPRIVEAVRFRLDTVALKREIRAVASRAGWGFRPKVWWFQVRRRRD